MIDKYITLVYESWYELKKSLVLDICGETKFHNNKYIFRGQKNEGWSLMATFDRYYGMFPPAERKKIEETLINKFTELCINWDGKENFKEYDELQLMSAGQHYGLPTRLLDWTYSIYIAAFFAYCDIEKQDSDAAIWVIDKENEIWKNHGVTIETCCIEENERQKYQYGLFTLNRSPEKSIEEFVNICSKNYDVEGALYKVVIPGIEKDIVLSDLEMMGINYFNMYRGMEGCAKAAVLTEFLQREF